MSSAVVSRRSHSRRRLAWVAEPLAEMGKTLETPYDEEYKARRSAALRAAGWRELRVQIQPERVAIH
jgi:hypothetical protein